VQECINNAIKHSSAAQIDVVATNEHPSYVIVIADNGIGMSSEVIAKSVGFKSLETRMGAINGRFIVESNVGHGTRITLNFVYDRKIT
jgi:signal transduction histidine kinase